MCRKLGAVLIALGVVCVLLAFCLDASASAPKRSVPPGRSVFLHFIHHSSDISPPGAFHFRGGRAIMLQIPPPEVPQ